MGTGGHGLEQDDSQEMASFLSEHDRFDMVWNKTIPKRLRVFFWLAHKGRFNIKTFMLRKQWKNVEHPFCDLCPTEETINNITLRCAPTHSLWQKLEIPQQAIASHSLKDFVLKMKAVCHH